jgi:hypothetical protein
MIADPGYYDQNLYDLSTILGFHLVCIVDTRYKNTPVERLQLVDFYESVLGQAINLFKEKYIHRTVIDRTYKINI